MIWQVICSRVYAIDFVVKLITFSVRNNMNSCAGDHFFRTNIHNIHQDGGSILCQALTCLMIEEIPAHLLRPRVLTRCQNPSGSAKIAQCRHQPHLLRAVHLRQPGTRRLRTDGVKKLLVHWTVGWKAWCCVLFTDFVLKCDCSFPDKFFVAGRFQVGFVQNKSEIAL